MCAVQRARLSNIRELSALVKQLRGTPMASTNSLSLSSRSWLQHTSRRMFDPLAPTESLRAALSQAGRMSGAGTPTEDGGFSPRMTLRVCTVAREGRITSDTGTHGFEGAEAGTTTSLGRRGGERVQRSPRAVAGMRCRCSPWLRGPARVVPPDRGCPTARRAQGLAGTPLHLRVPRLQPPGLHPRRLLQPGHLVAPAGTGSARRPCRASCPGRADRRDGPEPERHDKSPKE